MFISIGVTTYNRKKLTELCIKTINETVPKEETEIVVPTQAEILRAGREQLDAATLAATQM